MEEFEDPLGLGTRPRYSEEETVERMLDTAVDMAHKDGLRVSFDLQKLEDVIAQAGVSRSAVYKRWKRKEDFYSQVLLRLAGAAHPALAAYDPQTVQTAISVAQSNPELFRTSKGRHALFIEMCRLGALQNFDTLRERGEWHTYMALHATLLSLPENRFQIAMREALGRSERQFTHRMAEFYKGMVDIIGYRFRASVGDVGLDEFAALGGAVVIGLVLTATATPELAEQRFLIDPFSTGQLRDWSYPALGFASIAQSLVEEDPEVTWDDHRIATIPNRLRALLAAETERWTSGE